MGVEKQKKYKYATANTAVPCHHYTTQYNPL